MKVNTFNSSSKYERKVYKKQIFDESSPQSINLNGSGSDFSLNLKNDNQPNTNCTGPSESKNSSNNNKSDNNENDHPKKMKKLHCEENFQAQSNEYKPNSLDYLKNCQIGTFFNNRQSLANYTFSNNLPQNYAQNSNFYQINQNPMNFQNLNRNYPTVYTPVMVMGQDCMYQYMPVVQQQMVMGYPTGYPSGYTNGYPAAQAVYGGMNKMNYMQPMMNINGFYQNGMNGLINRKYEENRMEGKE